jgi:hypothetical protein
MERGTQAATWPADVIHVNEDGWVLINRGRAHGVAPGLRLFVVGSGTRELRDLFAAGDGEAPVVLRTRRTYELLEVVHAEERCAVAIAARAPAARRPQFYVGPGGELLVWVPLPEEYRWPPVTGDDEPDAADADAGAEEAGGDDGGAGPEDASEGDEAAADEPDTPPEIGEQDDQRWEQALPLNGVNVGDTVIPAVPVAPGAGTAAGGGPSGAGQPGSPWEQQYDWMRPPATDQ